jgi:cytoskeletal protein RodZ
LVIFPIWLGVTQGWPGIVLFLILLFFVSFQIRETIEYLVFSEEELKARFLKRSIKKREEVREVNAEIFKRRKRKNNRI